MALHWTELNTCDEDGNETNLNDFVAGCHAGVTAFGNFTLRADGSLDTWDQRYVYAPGEEPSPESPAGDVDWTGFAELMNLDLGDAVGTLATLVSIIDDPEFDASDPECVRDLVQYINIQCRAVRGVTYE